MATPSMYELTVPPLLRGFGVLSGYLDKASAFAAERQLDPAALVDARLAPDMLPLAGQVQRASDNAKGAIARLTGLDVPSFPDTEATLAELKQRIAKTVAVLKAVTPEHLLGSEERSVTLGFKSVSGTLRGDAYVLQVLLPNFFFHVATAHAILRHNGLQIGKRDYLG